MAPIRIGIIGLSATSGWAKNSHLPYLAKSTKYKIIAIANSSIESSKRAIAAYSLPSTTKAYGSAAELAQDPEIDLAVVAIRVDKHYNALKPVLEAGKSAFSEWPLGKNLKEAEELSELAKAKGVRTFVGLQGRQSNVAKKIKELIGSGRIGDFLSTSVYQVGLYLGAEDFEGFAFGSDITSGMNLVTIHFSHTMDTISQAIGDLTSYTSILSTKRQTTNIRDKPLTEPDAKILYTVPRNSYDHVLIQGHLASSSASTTDGPLFSYTLRGGPPVPGTPAIVWNIYGSKGEIRVTSNSTALHIGNPSLQIQVHDQTSGKVEVVQLEKDEWDEDKDGKGGLPVTARNVAKVYEAFADGRREGYADFADAVVRHRFVDELYTRAEKGLVGGKAEYTSKDYKAASKLNQY